MTYTYGSDGFGATVAASSSAEAVSAPAATGYATATVLTDTYGGAVWIGTGLGPGPQVGCGSGQGYLQAGNTSPNGSVLYVLVSDQGVPLGTDTVTCAPGPNSPGPPPPPPTVGQVWSAEASTWQSLVKSTIEVDPQGLGLTGLTSHFWLSNQKTVLQPAPASVAGYSVTASASIRSYTWLFGDGSSASSTSPGTAQSPATDHVYQAKGRYVVEVVAHYAGSFTFSGFGVAAQSVPFAIDVTMAQSPYGVQEIRSVLISPQGPGA